MNEINITKSETYAVGPTNVDSPIVASGKRVLLKKFGCLDPNIGDNIDSVVVLQWGKTGDWTTIRACTKIYEFNIKRDEFIGDGVKKFRLKVINNSAVPKTIGFWIEALILE